MNTTTSRYDYLRDPAEIYRRSDELVREATDLGRFPPELHPLVIRVVHSCGMPEVAGELHWRGNPLAAGAAALRAGKPIFADCRMVADGVIRSRLPAGNDVICELDSPAATQARAAAQRHGQAMTRSAAAVDAWMERLDGAVVAIGNAPTALFRWLELVDANPDLPRPAALFAFPVGFVGAAESKAALLEAELDVPCLTIAGRKGGSAMAAAAVNALTGDLGGSLGR